MPRLARPALSARQLALGLAVVLALAQPAAARGWRIANFEDAINVHPDGSAFITERITAVFTGQYKGIRRTIPIEHPGPHGANYTRFVNVIGVKEPDSGRALKYELLRQGDLHQLKIYLPGAVDTDKTVEIEYEVKNATRFFADHDEFYWNVTGNDWPVPIDHASALVMFPPAAGGQLRAQGFTWFHGSRQQEVNSEIREAAATFETTNPLPLHAGLTVHVLIPKDILHEPGELTLFTWFVHNNPVLLLPVIVFALMFGLWYTGGRDPDMGTQVSEARPGIKAERTRAGRNSTLLMIVLAGTAALAVVVPFFVLGNASGHDFEFHLASWMDVAGQWRAGVLYPRWAALANWGFGEPRFIFYPPASWMLGSALSFVLPWQMVPGAFIWLALTLAGVAMFTLAKEWLPTRDAMVAGALFALNPYHLVIVYWRSDFAELLASALIPLVVLFAVRMATQPRQALAPLAVVTATVWLCNAPAAVVVTYAIALILVIVAARERSAKPVIYGGSALALGLALAAFYIVPAAFERPWVNISGVLSQGQWFPENFLFTRTADAKHTSFNFIVSWVAVEVIAAALLAIIAASRWRHEHPRLWWVLVAVLSVATLLMLPVTSPVWAYLPELRYVQFPWRCLLVLDVPFAFCLAAAVGRLRGTRRHVACAVVLAGFAITGVLLTRNNWWDSGGVTHFYEECFSTGAGYFGQDEYGPQGSDHYDLDQYAPQVGLWQGDNAVSEPSTRVQVREWGLTRKEFAVNTPEPMTAALRLLNYPAWGVEVNGKPVRALSNQHTGEMLVTLPAGTSRVQVAFAATPDRRWGDIISAIAAVMLLAVVLGSRQRAAQPALPLSLTR